MKKPMINRVLISMSDLNQYMPPNWLTSIATAGAAPSPASSRASVSRDSINAVMRWAARSQAARLARYSSGVRSRASAVCACVSTTDTGVRNSCDASEVKRCCRSRLACSRAKPSLSTAARSASSLPAGGVGIRWDRSPVEIRAAAALMSAIDRHAPALVVLAVVVRLQLMSYNSSA